MENMDAQLISKMEVFSKFIVIANQDGLLCKIKWKLKKRRV